jgi:hypothetical protein
MKAKANDVCIKSKIQYFKMCELQWSEIIHTFVHLYILGSVMIICFV